VKPQEPESEQKPAQAMQEVLEMAEGPGILIEGPAVKLERPGSQRKLRRAMLVALLGLIGSIFAVMPGSPRFQRWYQVVRNTLDTTPTPLSSVKTISKPLTMATHADIVFLIDMGGSMQGQRIKIVKSAVSDFISRLSDRYLISVIAFDTDVELRIGLTGNHGMADQAVQSITVDSERTGSCVRDALYAGIQETSLAPAANDTQNVIIILSDTNFAPEDGVGSNCSLQSAKDFTPLAADHRVSIFNVHIGKQAKLEFFLDQAGVTMGGTIAAENESQMDRALLSISEKAGLELNPEPAKPVPVSVDLPAPMVFMPSGQFIMGTATVYLNSYWIDKTEVTNGMYGKCVQAGQCSPPRSDASHTRQSYYGNPEFDRYPVIYVSWLDAGRYCDWVGGRLPTEAEWEKAARGTDGRQFPWGDTDPLSVFGLLNFHGQDTTEVGIYPEGASPYGALDMAGNVSEWVADWLSPDYYNSPPSSNPLGPDSGEYRVWRGGSWANTSIDRVRTYSRTGNLPTDTSGGIGFRCARDAGP
jgi:hypothetical protein